MLLNVYVIAFDHVFGDCLEKGKSFLLKKKSDL